MAQITKNNSDTFGQIQDMLKAYYPILYLTTFEYDRTKQKLRGVAKNLNKNFQFYEWNCVDGLGKRDLNEGGLKLIENVEEHGSELIKGKLASIKDHIESNPLGSLQEVSKVLANVDKDTAPTLLLQAEEERVVDNLMHDRYC